MLFAKNAPEWAMAYFGIAEGGRDRRCRSAHESTVAELVNVARASGAVGMLIGDDLLEKHEDALPRALARGGAGHASCGRSARRSRCRTLEVETERAAALVRRQSPDALASLIFTSGTTGKPKGVMLTHRNFTFMVSELSKIFEFGVTDGMLSVLPLHHTFEFATGLLVPLARGAQITYLPELTGDAISAALKQRARHRDRRRAGAVGSAAPAAVPALRRQVARAGRLHARAREGELRAAQPRRASTSGSCCSCPVHEGFGGRIRYLISGGSALPPRC